MKPKLYFVAAVLLPSLLDGIVTLVGQPSSYWSDFSKIDEASPLTFLTFGPWIFLLSIVIYTAFLALVIYKLPKWLSIGVGLFFCMAHSNGVQGWIASIIVEKVHFLYEYWWYISVVYSLIIVILVSLGLRKWLLSEFIVKKQKVKH
jgi:hypothetical protein